MEVSWPQKCCCLVLKSCPTLFQPHGLQPARLLCSWNFPERNTGVGYHFLLHGVFLTQGLNPRLLHCRQTLYCLRHQGSLLHVKYKTLQQCTSISPLPDFMLFLSYFARAYFINSKIHYFYYLNNYCLKRFLKEKN